MTITLDDQTDAQALNQQSDSTPAHDLEKQQLQWSLMRLCQMQGGQLDPIRVKSGIDQLLPSTPAQQKLLALCRYLDKPKPKLIRRPDRVHIPMLACHPQLGRGIVIDRSPDGRWLMQTPEGPAPVSEDDLHKACIVLHLGPKVNLGLGLFINSDPSLNFFSHVRNTLMLYQRELVEACIASGFIGVLALATSLFSMQVYDRVIPTRSEYTLVILSAGVFISIILELAMKFARAHVMDYVVVGLDNR